MVKISYADSALENTVYVEQGEHLLEVKFTHEGVIVEVYRDNGNVYAGCYTGVTYDEIIDEVIYGEREPAPAAVTPSTEYYIGDPCYVLSDTQLKDLTARMDAQGEGYVGLGGGTVWAHGTYYGDGVYALRDDQGEEIASLAVDSGMLSAIPASMLSSEDIKRAAAVGALADLGDWPMCEYDEDTGMMRFGHLTVRTGE